MHLTTENICRRYLIFESKKTVLDYCTVRKLILWRYEMKAVK